MSPLTAFQSLQPIRKEKRSRKRINSSTATEDFLPTSIKNCASAFYSHPPTTVSLDQLKHAKPPHRQTLKTYHEKMDSLDADTAKPVLLFPLPAVGEEDVECQSAGCRMLRPKCSPSQIVALKIILGVFVVGVAITVGVTISWVVGKGYIDTVFNHH